MSSLGEINVKDLSFRYAEAKTNVLSNINLSIEPGEFVLVMGPSGCGKSTLFLHANGVIPQLVEGKLSGKVTVSGIDTQTSSVSELARHVGMVFQDPEIQLFALTVEEELAMVLENLGVAPGEIRKRVDWAISLAKLDGMQQRAPMELSAGEKQRVATAAMLTLGPEIMIFDEPTAYLDFPNTQVILNAVRDMCTDLKKTTVLIEHKIETVLKFVDRVVVLNADGTLYHDGDPKQVFSHVEELEEIGLRVPIAIRMAYMLAKAEPKFQFLKEDLPLTVDDLATVMSARRIIKTRPPPMKHAVGEGKSGCSSTPAVRVENLSYKYPATRKEVLSGINLTIDKGQYVALLGAGGSGKSVLAKHFIGLVNPSEGSVFVNGKDVASLSVGELARMVGYLFQNPDHQIFNATVYDELAYGPRNVGTDEKETRGRIERVLELTKLEGLEQRDPESLSMGQRLRLALGSVLVMDPSIIVLDEPTIGQDPGHLRPIMDLVYSLNREEGKTVILITHHTDLALEYCDRVIVMADGKILTDGSYYEVFRQGALLERCGVNQPAIARLMNLLFGEEAPLPRTVDDAVNIIRECIWE
ncbi:MAG: ABC transporter ATP-binding protein [Candidatus Bathyarchaeia archaeon]